MKTGLKKTIIITACLIMLLGVIGFGAVSENGFSDLFEVKASAASSGDCGENVTWSLNDEGTLTFSGTGEMMNFFSSSSSPWYGSSSIKVVIIEQGITSIGSLAFYSCTGLTSITIPDSVTSIGNLAFYSCTGLTSITIPDSVTKIGDHAFYGCTGLTSITIPDSVTNIGNSAFYGCTGLTSITVGNSVTNIGGSAFFGCTGLTSITVGNSVTNIGGSAFYGCTGLVSVSVPESVETIGENAFYMVNNVSYPGTASGNPWGAKCVNGYVEGNLVYNDSSKIELKGCSSSASGKIEIENTVKEIAPKAFYNCNNITEAIIPGSVVNIKETAFEGCQGIKTLSIGAGVRNIGKYSFADCRSIESVSFGEGIEYIDEYAFYGCIGIESVTIPGSVKKVGTYAFGGCDGLKTAVIINGAKTISYWAFRDCSNLENIYLPKSASFNGYRDYGSYSSIVYNCVRLRDVFFDGSYEDRPSLKSDDRLLEANWHYNASVENMDSIGVFILNYDAGGGNGAPSKQTGNGDVVISGSVPVREGYKFIGWAESSGASSAEYQPATVFKLIKNETLYAVWQKNETPENPDNPTNPTNPDNPTNPTNPDNPTNPTNPTNPDNPDPPLTDIPGANIIYGNSADNKKTYNYKTTVTFTANVPEGGSVQWYVDGKPAGNGSTLTVKDKTKDYTVKVVVTDKNGNQTMDEEQVTIKHGFFDILIWFFVHLFNPGAYDVKQ